MTAIRARGPKGEYLMAGRRWLVGLVLLVLLGVRPAWAGSYLDRAALLLAQTAQEREFLRGRLGDRELLRVAHRLAVARLEAAQQMQVPKEVVPAHPHLLLVLENHERALVAASARDLERWAEHEQRARDETELFKAILKQFGWSLPKL